MIQDGAGGVGGVDRHQIPQGFGDRVKDLILQCKIKKLPLKRNKVEDA